MTRGCRHFRWVMAVSLAGAAWVVGARGWTAELESTSPRVLPEARAAIEFRFSHGRLTEADRRLLNELASFIDGKGRPRFDMKTERESFLAVAWACWLLEAEAFNAGHPLAETHRAGGLVARELDQRFRWRLSDLAQRTFGPAGPPPRPASRFGVDRTLALDKAYRQRLLGTQGAAWATPPPLLGDGARGIPNTLETPSISVGFPRPVFTSFESVAVARWATMDAGAWPALTVDLSVGNSPAPFDPRRVRVGSMIGVGESAELGLAVRPTIPKACASMTWAVATAGEDGASRLGQGPADREAWKAALSISEGRPPRDGVSASWPTPLFGPAPTALHGDFAMALSAAGSPSRETGPVGWKRMADAASPVGPLANAAFQKALQQPGALLQGLYATAQRNRPGTNLGASALMGSMNGGASWRALTHDENSPLLQQAGPEELVFVRDAILRTLAPARVSIALRVREGVDIAWAVHRRTRESFGSFRRAARRADASWTNDARGLAALTDRAIRQKAWGDALGLAEAWMARDDAEVEAWFSAVQSAWETRRLDLVEEYATGLLDAFPASSRHANTYWLLGLAADQRQKPEAKRQWWERLIAEYPKTNWANEAKKRLAAPPPPSPESPWPPPLHEHIEVF